jgi:hypothetical protein
MRQVMSFELRRMGRGQQRNNRNTSCRVLLLFLYLLLPPPPLRVTALQVTLRDSESPKQEDWFDSLFRLKPVQPTDEHVPNENVIHGDDSELIQHGDQIQDGGENRKIQDGGHIQNGAVLVQDSGHFREMEDNLNGGQFQGNGGLVYHKDGLQPNGSLFIQDGDHGSNLYLEQHRVVVKCCPLGHMLHIGSEMSTPPSCLFASSSSVDNFTGKASVLFRKRTMIKAKKCKWMWFLRTLHLLNRRSKKPKALL